VMNSELDHIVRPSWVRKWLLTTKQHLNSTENLTSEDPLLLSWQNIYFFNRAMVSQMRRQWAAIDRQIVTTGHDAQGCPDWLEGKPFFPNCAQDIAYPIMARAIMEPPVKERGSYPPKDLVSNPGTCTQACWDFGHFHDYTSHWDTEDAQLEVIRRISASTSSLDAQSLTAARQHATSNRTEAKLPARSPSQPGAAFRHRIRKALIVVEAIRTMKKSLDTSMESRQNTSTSKRALDTLQPGRSSLDSDHVDKLDKVELVLRDLLQRSVSDSADEKCTLPARSVPIFHHAYYPSVQKLVRERLGL